ncbi:HET-domain-containing protein, partial [Setomelanomma holmii]
MDNVAPLEAFKHEPLADSTIQIRLLEVLEGGHGTSVKCRLMACSVQTAPPYYAVSYTWGDPALCTQITVNDKGLSIRRNCERALRQAYASEASRLFWIDAICIDQTSTQEKNHQVAMMGRIYAQAAHVFACVGPHADGSE